jgi:serine/threonine protein kinase
VKAWQGQGGYGAVYRAERVGFGRSEPGALKVSLSRWGWRMEREVELLSRLSHPSIPRLLDRGGRQSPSRDEYPFFVVEWVQGTPLYAWAEQHTPSAPSPADDLYALGVTAYRLVVGQYPARIETRQDEQGRWQAKSPDARRQLESNPRVEPALREVIVRLLSDEPEKRGTAAQVAEALEGPESSKPPERARARKPWLALAAAGVCAVLPCLPRRGSPLPRSLFPSRVQGSYGPTREASVQAVSR